MTPSLRVAIPARLSSGDDGDERVLGANRLLHDIAALVQRTGLAPVVVNETVDLGDFAGLVLPGGGDIDPSIYGGAQSDLIHAGNGADLLSGGGGHNHLFGQGGNDRLYGGKDNDLLTGGGGNDRLFGDAGDDQLDGGYGADAVGGGAGNDSAFADPLDLLQSIETMLPS